MSKDFSSTKRRWQRPKVAPQPAQLEMNSHHLTGTQIRNKESHLLKFRLCEFVSANLQCRVSSSPPKESVSQYSSRMNCMASIKFSLLDNLWLWLSPAQGRWNGRGASGATDFAWDNSKPGQSYGHRISTSFFVMKKNTENAGKKDRNVLDGLTRPLDDRGRPQSTSVRRHLLVLEVVLLVRFQHLTIFQQKRTTFHHFYPFSQFSYAAKYQLAASDCTQHRRSARAHIALWQPWRWMQFPNISLSGKQNGERSIWMNDFRFRK